MERRFVLFLVLAFAIFAGYFSLIQALYPPKKPQAKGEVAAKNEAGQAEKAKEAEKEKKPAKKEEQGKAAQPEAENKRGRRGKKARVKKPQVEEKAPEQAAEEPGPAEQWISLGSADPKDPYRMLVTLTNRGAALARVELSSSRYREIDDRSGYLGNLVMDKTMPGPGRRCKSWARHAGRQGGHQGRRRHSGNQRQAGHLLLFVGKREQPRRKAAPSGNPRKKRKTFWNIPGPGKLLKSSFFATAKS